MIHSYFLEGQDAYFTNPKTDCPYPEGSEARRSWVAGNNDAWWADREAGTKND